MLRGCCGTCAQCNATRPAICNSTAHLRKIGRETRASRSAYPYTMARSCFCCAPDACAAGCMRCEVDMRKKGSIGVALLIGVIAIAAPIVATLYLAEYQGGKEEMQRLEGLTAKLLRLSGETRAQINAAVDTLSASPDPPCSAETIEHMREIDVASTFLQAVGYIVDGRLMCSSLGTHGDGIPLGPIPARKKSGLRIWVGVKLPFVPHHVVNIYERNGFAAIVHPNLIMDALDPEGNVSIVLLGQDPPQVLRSRGTVFPNWINTYESDRSFMEGGYFVAIQSAKDDSVVALAASPVSDLRQRVHNLALILVPIGILAGLLLAAAVFFVASEQLSLRAELRAALRRNEFFLNYQPLVDLHNGKCIGVEALLRWRRRDGTMVRPDVFIPIAEESGLIQQVTKRVMEIVARDAPMLMKRHPDCHIAINLSAADLESESTVAMLKDLVHRAGIEPKNIVVEATERVFLRADIARPIVHAIRSMGIHVAIDDFGTGYSSLSYLHSFELDYLKIDKSFIDTLGTDAATSHVALHIIEMSKSLHIETIAEGVESQAQADLLLERGVRYAQGWLFGKPKSISDLLAHMDSEIEAPEKRVLRG
ncbi:EAL domain-containing protein [Herbaspirillum sp. HC18]|nr:EAL domain-containing protein [Herbaspirillum sp. HC18]